MLQVEPASKVFWENVVIFGLFSGMIKRKAKGIEADETL
jgi:hypothetical protein